MIQKIVLTDCIPYRQAELTDCQKINFVFGANGSGKSTISRLLSPLCPASDTRFDRSTIEWSSDTHEEIIVYNRDFRRANFQQDMRGIFTMGSATIEDIKKLDIKKAELSARKTELDTLNETIKKKEAEHTKREELFKEDAWAHILKRHESDFQRAFDRYRGSKSRFIDELKARIKGEKGQNGKVCPKDDLLTRAKALYVATLTKCSTISVSIQSLIDELNRIRLDDIWGTIIVGNQDVNINGLIEQLNMSSWVRQGRQYIQPKSRKCPFCQQDTITDDFRQQLSDFFDSDYEDKIAYITKLIKNYKAAISNLMTALCSIDADEYVVEIGNINTDILHSKIEHLNGLFESHIREMERKAIEPNIRINITDVTDTMREFLSIIDAANKLISDHNGLVEDSDRQKQQLTDDVWTSCIAESDSLISTYQGEISNIEKALAGMRRKQRELKTTIGELESEVITMGKNITSVEPTIAEINNSLRAYGFTNFSIVPAEGKENYYQIKRDDGTSAIDSLSEGEETFLSFLYFMQMTKGSPDQSRIANKKIIVLDDPISSLDSTILYIVGAMVKDLMKKIIEGMGDVTQLFVLTHNVFFHKEASFIDGRTASRSDVHYWIVRKNDGITTVCPYGTENPISTSYELLWKELKDDTNVSLISIQNTMRRIIENYFNMLGRKRDQYLVEQFDSTEDKMICRSLLCWINDGSHSIPDDLFIDSYTDAVPRYKNVFRQIFDKSGNLAHYNMMMGVVDS